LKFFNSIKFIWLIILFVIIGIVLLVFSVFDVLNNLGLIFISIPGYIVIVVLFLFLIFKRLRIKIVPIEIDAVEEFEKTLEGRLSHFQCPQCHGIFALKKSKENNQNPVKLMCPDCGAIGVIPATPQLTQAAIPEQKSRHAVFECTQCGETLTLWAEGVELYTGIRVFTCPYCGVEQSMSRL